MHMLRWGEEARTVCAISSWNNGAYHLCAWHVVLEDEDLIEAQLTRSLASKLVLKLAMRNSTMQVLPLVAASWRGVRCVCMCVGQRKINYVRIVQASPTIQIFKENTSSDRYVVEQSLRVNCSETFRPEGLRQSQTVSWLTKTLEVETSYVRTLSVETSSSLLCDCSTMSSFDFWLFIHQKYNFRMFPHDIHHPAKGTTTTTLEFLSDFSYMSLITNNYVSLNFSFHGHSLHQAHQGPHHIAGRGTSCSHGCCSEWRAEMQSCQSEWKAFNTEPPPST